MDAQRLVTGTDVAPWQWNLAADPDIAAVLARLQKRVEADKAADEVRRKHKAKIEWGMPRE